MRPSRARRCAETLLSIGACVGLACERHEVTAPRDTTTGARDVFVAPVHDAAAIEQRAQRARIEPVSARERTLLDARAGREGQGDAGPSATVGSQIQAEFLAVELRQSAGANRPEDGYILRVRLTNRGAARIAVDLRSEPLGGIPFRGAFQAVCLQPDGRFTESAVYPTELQQGEPDRALREVRWMSPAASITVDLHLDWPGTGSRPVRERLIPRRADRYVVQLSMEHRRDGDGSRVATLAPLAVVAE